MKNLQQSQHFSHHHVLIPLILDEDEKINCNGCETLIHEPFHGCLPCNFHLHDTCINTPRFLQHSSHPDHHLTLLSTPMYPTRSYSCNACGCEGKSFSFSCAKCEFDLHLQCAWLPNTILINDKHPHKLELMFGSPYEDKSTMFCCDICSLNMDQNQWLYYCAPCDFGAHLGCADGKVFASAGRKLEAQGNKEENPHNSAVQMINSVNDAHEQLVAAQVKALIDAQGRQAILDLWSPPRRRYDYY